MGNKRPEAKTIDGYFVPSVPIPSEKPISDYTGKAAPWPVMRITVKPDNDMPMQVSRR